MDFRICFGDGEAKMMIYMPGNEATDLLVFNVFMMTKSTIKT